MVVESDSLHSTAHAGQDRAFQQPRERYCRMALKKRGKIWHTHFVVNGQRFRQSLGTTDWREAQAKQKEMFAQASEGKLTQSSLTLARQPFNQAADDYQTVRILELAPASRAKEKQLLLPEWPPAVKSNRRWNSPAWNSRLQL